MFSKSESKFVVDRTLGVEKKAIVDDEVEVVEEGQHTGVLVGQHLWVLRWVEMGVWVG